MDPAVVFLSIPALRSTDIDCMPRLRELAIDRAKLASSFPCVTWPVQANMMTGRLANQHGVVANGFYWRERNQVEMWTAANQVIQRPQVWDVLHKHSPTLTSAVWFPMLSKRSGADFVCMPAPVHNPDGSESLWCYTQPTDLYGTLQHQLGDFPLKNFWGPLANIASTAWIIDSAVLTARKYRPRFAFLYLPHLDYAAQRDGPDSPAATSALAELDDVIGKLIDGFADIYGPAGLTWLVASEYVITDVDHVCYPNRMLREAGLLKVRTDGDGEMLDLQKSKAWALVDHQFSHVFVRDGDPETVQNVVRVFAGQQGVAEILAGDQKAKYGLDHPRSGEVVIVSEPTSWQAYYWWFDDALAPGFARTVDIHRKPGYDPVELHLDLSTKSIPLDAGRVRGSHGAPVQSDSQCGVLAASRPDLLPAERLQDVDVAAILLNCFGL